jgi:hypothetical protein
LLAAAGGESPLSAHPHKWTPVACNTYTNENEAKVNGVKGHFRLMKKPFKHTENVIF